MESNSLRKYFAKMQPKKGFGLLIVLTCFVLALIANWGPGSNVDFSFHENFIDVEEETVQGRKSESRTRKIHENDIALSQQPNADNPIVNSTEQSFLDKLYYRYLQIAQPQPDIVNINAVEDEEPIDPDLSYKSVKSIWTYRCDENRGCMRDIREENETFVEPEVCWLNCGLHGALWPYPKQVDLGPCLLVFSKDNVVFMPMSVLNKNAKELLHKMWDVVISRLEKIQETSAGKKITTTGGGSVRVKIFVNDNTTKLSLDTDESYTMSVTSETSDEEECDDEADGSLTVIIKANSVFGARHALETLTQLIAFDKAQQSFKIVSNVTVADGPEFPYRGILIDTARNFIPIDDLKRLIDGMAHNKLNILHWHITDSNSFPFFSKRVPQMTQYGAYGVDKVYYPNEVRELLNFALVRGVKIIPELDAPAHAGNGWQWGLTEGLGNLAVCVNEENWRNYCGQPPCGQLNPVNPNTFLVLEKLYRDFFEVFDDDLFHMGGDEVYQECWVKDAKIAKFTKKDPGFSFLKLWGSFQEEAWIRLKRANEGKSVKAIVWTSKLINSEEGRKSLNSSDYIIQVWDGRFELIRFLFQNDYQLILSNMESAYLDHGAGTWLGTDHIYTYRQWQSFYDNHLPVFIPNFSQDRAKPASQRQLLGSEATLWSEKVNSQNMDSRTWPRSCALAENLWSNPPRRLPLVYSRLNHHNRRLILLGIHSSTLQPESCYLLSGHCDDPLHSI